VCKRLAEINGFLWIEKAWTPPLQQEGDASIMERFAKIAGITTGILKKANIVCIYLRVITIADLANPEGTTIPDGLMKGDWQAGIDLIWPQILCPPKPYWAIFKKCMKATFFKQAPQHQPSHYSVSLYENLGPWYKVKCNTWYPCYKAKNNLYLRQHDSSLISKLSPSKTKGYYHTTGTVSKIQTDSHPIAHQQVRNNWHLPRLRIHECVSLGRHSMCYPSRKPRYPCTSRLQPKGVVARDAEAVVWVVAKAGADVEVEAARHSQMPCPAPELSPHQ
jgi:hypothetical protein